MIKNRNVAGLYACRICLLIVRDYQCEPIVNTRGFAVNSLTGQYTDPRAVGVANGAAFDDRVIAGDHVVAGAAVEPIVGAANQAVGIVTADDIMTADDIVVIVTAVNRIVALLPEDDVLTGLAMDRVVTTAIGKLGIDGDERERCLSEQRQRRAVDIAF
jgi:hypothetical protein